MAFDSPSHSVPADAPYPRSAMDQPDESRLGGPAVPLSSIRLTIEQEDFRRRAIPALSRPNTPAGAKVVLGGVVLGPRPEGDRAEALGMPELYDATVTSLYRDLLDAPAGAAHVVELRSETKIVLSEDGNNVLPIQPRHLTAVNLVALNNLHRLTDSGVNVLARAEALGDVETRRTLLYALEQGRSLAESRQERAAEQVVEPLAAAQRPDSGVGLS